ncbi:hypothetical protein ONZ51_g4353 [Trametes cubensis]|uniref:Uncharacterized protein n=1 Tax=Trametes cubensis TaxID=1111947 RepID=A0AAD7TW72_9APHY|nr:hypothetical protein ONZ51_g4353 [Trametes cubensis]
MCHWRRVRNNYKRCGHYVDLPDEMVRPSTAYLSEDLNSVGTTALRFNVTIVTASSAPRIPGTVFHPAARRLVGSTVNSPNSITHFAQFASSLAVLRD